MRTMNVHECSPQIFYFLWSCQDVKDETILQGQLLFNLEEIERRKGNIGEYFIEGGKKKSGIKIMKY